MKVPILCIWALDPAFLMSSGGTSGRERSYQADQLVANPDIAAKAKPASS